MGRFVTNRLEVIMYQRARVRGERGGGGSQCRVTSTLLQSEQTSCSLKCCKVTGVVCTQASLVLPEQHVVRSVLDTRCMRWYTPHGVPCQCTIRVLRDPCHGPASLLLLAGNLHCGGMLELIITCRCCQIKVVSLLNV